MYRTLISGLDLSVARTPVLERMCVGMPWFQGYGVVFVFCDDRQKAVALAIACADFRRVLSLALSWLPRVVGYREALVFFVQCYICLWRVLWLYADIMLPRFAFGGRDCHGRPDESVARYL